MSSMFESLFLPCLNSYKIQTDINSYKKCGFTLSCSDNFNVGKFNEGFFWYFCIDDLFIISIYDFKAPKNFSFKYRHPEFFTVGLYNKTTAEYITDSSHLSQVLTYTRPEGYFAAKFKRGDCSIGSSITFSPEFLMNLSHDFNIDYNAFINICFNPLIQSAMPDVEFALKQIFDADPPASQAKIYYTGKILELLSLIIQYKLGLLAMKSSVYISPDDNTSLEHVASFMHENYNKEITIQTLESISYMGKNKLSQTFKCKYGIPMMNYLSNIRIEQAKILLMDFSLSIDTIAHMIGYHNQGSFSEKFKKLTGLTPSEYRKNQYNHN